jgi:hypothetical protein
MAGTKRRRNDYSDEDSQDSDYYASAPKVSPSSHMTRQQACIWRVAQEVCKDESEEATD